MKLFIHRAQRHGEKWAVEKLYILALRILCSEHCSHVETAARGKPYSINFLKQRTTKKGFRTYAIGGRRLLSSPFGHRFSVSVVFEEHGCCYKCRNLSEENCHRRGQDKFVCGLRLHSFAVCLHPSLTCWQNFQFFKHSIRDRS